MATATKTTKKAKSVMIRVPVELKERMDRIAAEMLETYESGRGCQDVELTEQGSRGTWVPTSEVIRKALDELEDHKARSRKSNRKATVEA